MTDTQGTCGSYDMTALPNLVSIPLIKPKQTAPDNLNYFSEKEGWELGYDDQMTSACVAEGTWDFVDETFHDSADKQQLSRPVKKTVERIDLFSSATILQTCQPILTALNANKNHQHVLLFARKLDYHLHTKFFTGSWSNNFLQKAINQLKVDKKLPFVWKKLLQNILIPESEIKLSSQVLSAFVRKFRKRRCVTYLARDVLAPKHEEDASSVRQMLQKFTHKAYSNTTSKAQSGDICFRWEKQGRWANECPEGHELEWLANQNCFLCGKKGHLKEACPNKIKKDDHFKPKLEENKPPSVKPSWYQNSTSLIKLLGNLSVK